jgi:hypothetical protein
MLVRFGRITTKIKIAKIVPVKCGTQLENISVPYCANVPFVSNINEISPPAAKAPRKWMNRGGGVTVMAPLLRFISSFATHLLTLPATPV